MSTPTLKSIANCNIAACWGAKNAVNIPGGTLIDGLTITPKNGEPIDIEDGDGFSAILAGLEDGFNAKATCIYDSNKAYPAQGDTIVIVIPKTGANAGTQDVNCTFWSWSFTRTKKKEPMIELNFTYRPNING